MLKSKTYISLQYFKSENKSKKSTFVKTGERKEKQEHV